MVISLFAGLGVSSFAVTQGVLTYEISDGEATITDCDESATGELIIPDTLDGCPVTCIGDFAFFKCISLTSITIPGSVTIIETEAFDSCSSLTSIDIPDYRSVLPYLTSKALALCLLRWFCSRRRLFLLYQNQQEH